MIHIKKDHEIEAMRLAGGVSSTVLREVAAYVKPGMSTLEIDQYGGERIRHHGGKSAFLGYRDYPCNICISVNEEVVHGLASQRRVQFGDIVSVDVGVRYEGFIGDNATTVVVGGCDPAVQRLMEVTEQALYDGLGQALAATRSWTYRGRFRELLRPTDTASCGNLSGTAWAKKSTRIPKFPTSTMAEDAHRF